MKTLFVNTYDGESIVDASRDFSEALLAEFNPAVAELPVDQYGFTQGKFKVVIEWCEEEKVVQPLNLEETINEMHVDPRGLDDICFMCDKPADFVKSTQFAGLHLYCREHALEQSDFAKDTIGYAFWYRLEDGA